MRWIPLCAILGGATFMAIGVSHRLQPENSWREPSEQEYLRRAAMADYVTEGMTEAEVIQRLQPEAMGEDGELIQPIMFGTDRCGERSTYYLAWQIAPRRNPLTGEDVWVFLRVYFSADKRVTFATVHRPLDH